MNGQIRNVENRGDILTTFKLLSLLKVFILSTYTDADIFILNKKILKEIVQL